MTAVAVLILYGNVAVIFQPGKLGMGHQPWLPRPFLLQDAFLMTGMFNSYTVMNSRFVLSGRAVDGDEPGLWLKLDIKEHFPERTGVTYTRLWAARHWDMLGREAQRRAWDFMAAKIVARHNRLHPARRINRVRLGAVRWPISKEGYWAAKHPWTTRSQLFHEGPRP